MEVSLILLKDENGFSGTFVTDKMTLRPQERVASILQYFLSSNHSAVRKQLRILYMMCLSVVGSD